MKVRFLVATLAPGMAASALILNTMDILFLFVIKALVTVTKTPLNLSGLSGKSGCHVEQKVPRVEQKFHLYAKMATNQNTGGIIWESVSNKNLLVEHAPFICPERCRVKRSIQNANARPKTL